jgi:hypothetical protein
MFFFVLFFYVFPCFTFFSQPFLKKKTTHSRLRTWPTQNPRKKAAEGEEIMSALQHSIDRFMELAESEGAFFESSGASSDGADVFPKTYTLW